MVTSNQICWSEILVAICNRFEQLQWSTHLLTSSARVGEALGLKENDGAPFVLRCGVSSTRGTWNNYLVKMGLVYSIGISWLTTGWAWVSLEVIVHVLIFVIVQPSRTLIWGFWGVGKQGEHFPCFPSCDNFYNKIIHVFCYKVVITWVEWYGVILVHSIIDRGRAASAFQNCCIVWWIHSSEREMPCVFGDAGLVSRGHDPAFFVLLVVF